MTLALLIDNDIVIKLAQLDAYVETLSATGVSPASVGSIAAMLRYMGLASEANRARLTRSEAEGHRLAVVLKSITPLEMTADEVKTCNHLMKLILQNELDIDGGELMLMVVAASRGSLDVATGDKRALLSLPSLHDHWPVLATLRGRFWCLESMIRCLCETVGFSFVRTSILRAPHADTALYMVYERASASSGDQFIPLLRFVVKEQLDAAVPGWLKEL
jgi:primosomal replication protein N